MNTINYHQLLQYSLRSQTAYCLNQLGWLMTEHLGWRSPSHHRLIIQEAQQSEVNVIVEIDDQQQTQWIAVRGSSNLKNWLLNFQYAQRYCEPDNPHMPCGGIDLHKGFRFAATEILYNILPHLHHDYTTRLTGHSLGGAIASILMLFLAELEFKIERCITFGQPKITDKVGAKKIATMPLIRVVHDDDIVPHLPATTPLTFLHGGYEHFGAKVVLQDSRISPALLFSNEGKPKTVSTGFWNAVLRALFRTNIRSLSEHIGDHDLRKYAHSIINMIKAQAEGSDYEERLLQALVPSAFGAGRASKGFQFGQ